MSEFKIKNKNLKHNSKYVNLALKYIPCLIKGIIITIVGILVLSFAYYKMSSNSVILYYLTYLFIALGAFVTGNSTYHKLGGRGIVAGTIGSIPLIVCDLISVLIFNHTKVSGLILIIVPICVISGAIGGIVGSNAKKRY